LQLDAGEVGDSHQDTPMRSRVADSTATASQPANTYESTPAYSAGRPARTTCRAPDAFRDAASCSACSSYSASLEHSTAWVAPLSSKPPSVTGSMPPAWKRLAANVERAVYAAAEPIVARKIRGREPVAARCASERARSASYASSRRTRGSPP